MKKTPLTLKKFQESVLLFLLVVLHVGKNILKVYQNMVTTKGPNVTSKNMAAKAIKCECEEYKNSSLVIFIARYINCAVIFFKSEFFKLYSDS